MKNRKRSNDNERTDHSAGCSSFLEEQIVSTRYDLSYTIVILVHVIKCTRV